MKIKLCGMMREQDIQNANVAMPDYVGFVFANTKRNIRFETAKQFRAMLDPAIEAVGVFVNEKEETIASLLNEGIIDIAQLHGQETIAYMQHLRKLTDKPLWKAIKVQSAQDIIGGMALPADGFLLDTFKAGILGGSGEQFNWNLLAAATKPYFLAGGIDSSNIEEAMAHKPYGIDVSSGIETNGKKDAAKMKKIVELVRQHL